MAAHDRRRRGPFTGLANALAGVMASRGLSCRDVAEDARVAVDDVRSVLAGNHRFVERHVITRIEVWLDGRARSAG